MNAFKMNLFVIFFVIVVPFVKATTRNNENSNETSSSVLSRQPLLSQHESTPNLIYSIPSEIQQPPIKTEIIPSDTASTGNENKNDGNSSGTAEKPLVGLSSVTQLDSPPKRKDLVSSRIQEQPMNHEVTLRKEKESSRKTANQLSSQQSWSHLRVTPDFNVEVPHEVYSREQQSETNRSRSRNSVPRPSTKEPQAITSAYVPPSLANAFEPDIALEDDETGNKVENKVDSGPSTSIKFESPSEAADKSFSEQSSPNKPNTPNSAPYALRPQQRRTFENRHLPSIRTSKSDTENENSTKHNDEPHSPIKYDMF